MFHHRSCLVTGAAGFMGASLVRMLAEQGAVVVATDTALEKPAAFAGLDVYYVPCDLLDKEDIVQKLIFWCAYDYVFHMSGVPSVDASDDVLHVVGAIESRNLHEALMRYDNPPKRFISWSERRMRSRSKED